MPDVGLPPGDATSPAVVPDETAPGTPRSPSGRRPFGRGPFGTGLAWLSTRLPWSAVLLWVLVVLALTPLTLRRAGVHAGSSVLYLTAPTTTTDTNPLAQPGEGVVPFAGAIARAVAQRPPAYRFSSALAPIFGSGETDATAIRPYDAGGQWNRSFTRPFVIIDVVSSTAEGARARMVAATAQVESAVRALQDQAGVAADVRVDVFPAVTTPPIAEVRGSRVRALGMSVLVGFGVALLFTAWRRARAT